jgi:hypothetical protein
MFGLKMLTWNTGYQQDNFSPSVNNLLFGGSLGHAAAELIIPKRPENTELLNRCNQLGQLIVREEKTLITQESDKNPNVGWKEVECYRIYFSFWG